MTTPPFKPKVYQKQKNPNAVPHSPPEKGNRTPTPIYTAMGRALVTWERCENTLGIVFGILIGGGKWSDTIGSYAAARAYGSVITSRGRVDMLKAAAEVFFGPHESKAREIFALMLNQVGVKSVIRNNIAHGMVMGWVKDGKDYGYFLEPSRFATGKRKGAQETPTYRYTAKEILEHAASFDRLQSAIIAARDFIIAL